MNLKILKNQTKFIMGITSPKQLEDWCSKNQSYLGLITAGRSNVGKSSFINALLGQKIAKISKTPGRTRQVNIFKLTMSRELGPLKKEIVEMPIYLFDLPGYGYAEISKQMRKEWNILLAIFFENIIQTTLLLNLQDARHPDQKVDKEFKVYAENTMLTTFLLLNKMDKLKKQKDRAILKKKQLSIFKNYKSVDQIHFISSVSKQGIDELENSILSYWSELL